MLDLDTIKADNATRRAIKDKASDGPWVIKYSSNVAQVVFSNDQDVLVFDTVSDFPAKEADVQLIVSARNDNPEDVIDALIKEIEQLRKQKGTP